MGFPFSHLGLLVDIVSRMWIITNIKISELTLYGTVAGEEGSGKWSWICSNGPEGVFDWHWERSG